MRSDLDLKAAEPATSEEVALCRFGSYAPGPGVSDAFPARALALASSVAARCDGLLMDIETGMVGWPQFPHEAKIVINHLIDIGKIVIAALEHTSNNRMIKDVYTEVQVMIVYHMIVIVL